jgi:polar amino acid transport system permease protein
MNDFTLGDILHALLGGLQWTAILSLTAFVLGSCGGLIILALRLAHRPVLVWLAKTFIEVFQGTPLLMQLFIVFFGLSLGGVEIPPWLAAALGLTLYTSAYLAEIWRGCVNAIPNAQWEGSAALALNRYQQMRHVILPQALRMAIAPTVGFLVQVVKGTSVASIIGFIELTKTGGMLANATFEPFLIYGLVAAGYFLLCYPLSLYSRHLERTLHVAR